MIGISIFQCTVLLNGLLHWCLPCRFANSWVNPGVIRIACHITTDYFSKVWKNNPRPRLWRFLKSKNFNTSPAVADPDLQGRGWGGFPPLDPPLRGTLIFSMSPSNSSWSPFGSNRNSAIWICHRHCHSYLKRLSPTRSHTFPFCIVNDRGNSSSE